MGIDRDMDARIENALQQALRSVRGEVCPPKLREALNYALFPGGGRLRPRLCLEVAAACGDSFPACADGAAAAIELLHCASLVHDDLPCFDAAETRRGRPSLHRVFGEPLAVLVGDGLIVLAFQTLSTVAGTEPPGALAALSNCIARAAGVASGLVAGQAWECEPCIDLERYHRAKTAALFEAATEAGALAAGHPGEPWRTCGQRLGEAYQIADDLADRLRLEPTTGKTAGRDKVLGRPSAANLGIPEAKVLLQDRLDEAVQAVPICTGRPALVQMFLATARRLLPRGLSTAVESGA